jgi:hypothetical protein
VLQPPLRLLLAQGGRPGLDDLAALDKQLHANLLTVKACPPDDVESLGLTFSVEQQLFGRVRPVTTPLLNCQRNSISMLHFDASARQLNHAMTVTWYSRVEHATSCNAWCCLCAVLQTVQTDLLPGGDALAVTGDNRLLYVHLLADHLLNTRLGRATAAFAGEHACVCAATARTRHACHWPALSAILLQLPDVL